MNRNDASQPDRYYHHLQTNNVEDHPAEERLTQPLLPSSTNPTMIRSSPHIPRTPPPRHVFQLTTTRSSPSDDRTDAGLLPSEPPEFSELRGEGERERMNYYQDDHHIETNNNCLLSFQLIQSQRFEEQAQGRIMLHLLGQDYAAHSHFWCHSIPLAICIGGVGGLVQIGFLTMVQYGQQLWWSDSIHNNHLHHSTTFGEEVTRGKWSWVIVTALAGLASGVCRLLYFVVALYLQNRHSPVATQPSMIAAHALASSTSSSGSGAPNDETLLLSAVLHTATLVTSSAIVLAAGAPLGPETAVVALLTIGAKVLLRLLPRPPCALPTNDDNVGSRASDTLEQPWTLCALAAALAGWLPSPILAPLLVLELTSTLDKATTIASSTTTTTTTTTTRTTRNKNAAAALQLHQSPAVEQPLLHQPAEFEPAPVAAPTGATPCIEPLEVSSSSVLGKSHYQENIVLHFLSAFSAFFVIRGLRPDLLLWNDKVLQSSGVVVRQSYKEQHEDWMPTLVATAAAIPLGILCGLLGSVVLILLYALRLLGNRILLQQRSHSSAIRSVVSMLLLPTLAGLSQGVIAIVWPRVLTPFYSVLSHETIHTNQNNLTVSDLTWTIVTRLAGLIVTLGLGRMIGGIVLPMLAIGLLFGQLVLVLLSDVASSSSFFLQISPMIVPCCMAACTVSVCPIPMTAALALTLGYCLTCTGNENDWTADRAGPAILMACLSAWAVTGGSGLLQRFAIVYLSLNRHPLVAGAVGISATPLLFVPGDTTLDQDDMSVAQNNSFATENADEVLRSIRSLIFGGGQSTATTETTTSAYL